MVGWKQMSLAPAGVIYNNTVQLLNTDKQGRKGRDRDWEGHRETCTRNLRENQGQLEVIFNFMIYIFHTLPSHLLRLTGHALLLSPQPCVSAPFISETGWLASELNILAAKMFLCVVLTAKALPCIQTVLLCADCYALNIHKVNLCIFQTPPAWFNGQTC